VFALISAFPASSGLQCTRISFGPMSALVSNRIPANLSLCTNRAPSTRSRTLALGSPQAIAAQFLVGFRAASTRGTSACKSMRSISGPEMRFW
jgi:hypothetical protein